MPDGRLAHHYVGFNWQALLFRSAVQEGCTLVARLAHGCLTRRSSRVAALVAEIHIVRRAG
jgi:hypothetical protein